MPTMHLCVHRSLHLARAAGTGTRGGNGAGVRCARNLLVSTASIVQQAYARRSAGATWRRHWAQGARARDVEGTND